MNSSNNREFWQFSDQLRLHTANLANISIGNSIWSDNSSSSSNRNFDSNANPSPSPAATATATSDGWKMGGLGTTQKLAFGYGFSNNLNNTNDTGRGSGKGGNYGNNNNYYFNSNHNGQMMMKSYFDKAVTKPAMITAHANNNRNNNNTNDYSSYGNGKKKSSNNNSSNSNNNSNNNNGSSLDKRFKTLPPSEALPRNEAVGGYIFVCNNDTMHENLRRELFGLPPRYKDSVRAITPGLPLFLYNYSTHQLHGIFEAACFGGTNIDPRAWEDKKSHGESRFPAQVRVLIRKICEPLEEDSFRPILHHYDGPKFRLELSVPEALALLDIFAETNA